MPLVPPVKQTPEIAQIPLPQVASASQIPAKALATASFYSPAVTKLSHAPTPVRQVISSDDNNGPIREVPAPNLGPKPTRELDGIAHAGSNGFDAFKESTANFNAYLKNPGFDISNFAKYPTGDISFGGDHAEELSDFQHETLDVTNLLKPTIESEKHGSGYEVREHHAPTNDQVIKSHDGTKLFYAPDPDPSLPVHKVPPTRDPHSTPTNNEQVKNFYVSPITHGFPYLQGGSLGEPTATLSPHQLLQLMYGYPTVLSQSVLTFPGQTQQSSGFLSGLNYNYYHQDAGASSENADVAKLLQNPEIHNLLHNNPDSHRSYFNQYQEFIYSPQNQYQNYGQSNYQHTYSTDTNSVGSVGSVAAASQQYSDVDENQDQIYEPEASESKHSVKVVRKADESSRKSAKAKDFLSNFDSNDSIELSNEKHATAEPPPQVYQFGSVPEVPFYSSLPNEETAKAFASLQAAGSVASNYLSQIKNQREDRTQGNEVTDERRKTHFDDSEDFQFSAIKKFTRLLAKDDEGFDDFDNDSPAIEEDNFEDRGRGFSTTASGTEDYDDSLEDSTEFIAEKNESDLSDLDFKEDAFNEAFGKRIRPK